MNGKICIVTGAASGIGYATSVAFAELGAQVIAVDRDAVGLSTLAGHCSGVETRALDITGKDAAAFLFATLEHVDVVFNCAGMVAVGNILDCSDADWQRSVDLNVTSMFRLCRAAVSRMRANGGGSIVNMASVISSVGAAPDRFAYGATKAAVIGLTKSIALDFAGDGIRCNAICPSAVETPSMTARIEAMENPATARAAFAARQPVGRMATPDEIAGLAVYLASDASEFITGSAIIVDGGAKL